MLVAAQPVVQVVAVAEAGIRIKGMIITTVIITGETVPTNQIAKMKVMVTMVTMTMVPAVIVTITVKIQMKTIKVAVPVKMRVKIKTIKEAVAEAIAEVQITMAKTQMITVVEVSPAAITMETLVVMLLNKMRAVQMNKVIGMVVIWLLILSISQILCQKTLNCLFKNAEFQKVLVAKYFSLPTKRKSIEGLFKLFDKKGCYNQD